MENGGAENGEEVIVSLDEEKLKSVRGIFRRLLPRKKYDEIHSFLDHSVTVADVKKMLSFRSYFEIAFLTATTLLLSLFLTLTKDPFTLAVYFAQTFIITFASAYTADRARRPLAAKLAMLATSSTDKIYNVMLLLGEAVSDGKITPDELAKIVSAIIGSKKK